MKVSFDGTGGIDFIVAGHVTDDFARKRNLLGQDVLLETVPETIAKKIVYRGSGIQPRDVFDIAAAVEAGHGDEIKAVPKEIQDDVAQASKSIASPLPDHVESVIPDLVIRDGFRSLAPKTRLIAQKFLDTCADPRNRAGFTIERGPCAVRARPVSADDPGLAPVASIAPPPRDSRRGRRPGLRWQAQSHRPKTNRPGSPSRAGAARSRRSRRQTRPRLRAPDRS